MADAWRDSVDPARVAAWMAAQGLGAGALEDVRQLAGGTQNILLRFTFDGGDYVLRRPPKNPRPGNNETMRREARVLGALRGSAVPHPALIASCEDESVIGAFFYLMAPIDGANITLEVPDLYRGDADARRRLGLSMADAIAALGRLDYVEVGLADFGKPQGFLDRQASRWKTHFDSFSEFAEWPGPESLPGVDAIADWLSRHKPAAFTPGVMHGDFHFGNVIVRVDQPELAAIVDWELATIGDPLLDLGWLLATWPTPDGRGGVFDIAPWEGFPTASELVARYAQNSARDVGVIDWHVVLACFKLGVINEGTFARACAGKTSQENGAASHARALALFERARGIMR